MLFFRKPEPHTVVSGLPIIASAQSAHKSPETADKIPHEENQSAPAKSGASPHSRTLMLLLNVSAQIIVCFALLDVDSDPLSSPISGSVQSTEASTAIPRVVQ